MFSYIAYGLGIRSSLPLPELITGNGRADVTVCKGTVPPSSPEAMDLGSLHRFTPEEALLIWKDAVRFLVRAGNEIVVDSEPGVDEHVVRLYLLGPALAMLLHQRHHLVLHASAVAINGWAIGFLGGSGWGKSTIAGALHDRGHPAIADDVVAVEMKTSGCPIVAPGFPRLKLWPDSAVALGCDPKTMSQLHPKLEKRARSVPRGFPSTALPLKQIYVLADGSALGIERLQPQEALVELIRHTYGVRLLQSTRPPSHLQQYAAVVNSVPVCRLTVPRNLSLLPNLARLVEEDALRP